MPAKPKAYYKANSINDDKAHEKSVRITKFTPDLEVESSYMMNFIETANGGYYDCQCPAAKFDCRHKTILTAIDAFKQRDGEKFYCFETKTFHDMKDVN